MGKRKNSSSIPRHKRMRRQNRLQAAKHWIPTYPGKNIVRGYARHFAVDLLCAVKELEMLGNQFKPEYVDQLKRSIAAHIEQKQKRLRLRLRLKEEDEMFPEFDSDDEYCFIAGYTSDGAPYGVKWEEIDSDNEWSCSDESYLFEDQSDQLDSMDTGETEEPDLEYRNVPRGLVYFKEGEDDIPF